jgi:hypothetical protein
VQLEVSAGLPFRQRCAAAVDEGEQANIVCSQLDPLDVQRHRVVGAAGRVGRCNEGEVGEHGADFAGAQNPNDMYVGAVHVLSVLVAVIRRGSRGDDLCSVQLDSATSCTSLDFA